MKRLINKLGPSWLAAIVVLVVGCGGAVASSGLDRIDEIMNSKTTQQKVFVPPLPDSPDFLNYNKAQRQYASKNTILWCTFFPDTPGSRPFTVPIVGKLTSSSVSFYPDSRVKIGGGDFQKEYTPDRRSVDGMYHGTPPPYRYGFDAVSDAYQDFANLGQWCSSAPQPSQIQNTELNVKLVQNSQQLDKQAEAALARGDKQGAQNAVSQVGNIAGAKTP